MFQIRLLTDENNLFLINLKIFLRMIFCYIKLCVKNGFHYGIAPIVLLGFIAFSVYQVSDLFVVYFNTQTLVNVEFEYPPDKDLPALTICAQRVIKKPPQIVYPLLYNAIFIWLKALFVQNEKEYEESLQRLRYLEEISYDNLTLGQISDRLLNDTDVIKNCQIRNNKSDVYNSLFIDCEKPILMFYPLLGVCFTHFSQLDNNNVIDFGSIKNMPDIYSRYFGRGLAKVTLNPKIFSKEWKIYAEIHAKNVFPHILPRETLEIELGKSYIFNYKKTQMKRINKIFHKICHEYDDDQNDGPKSRSHCLEECLKQLVVDEHHCLPRTHMTILSVPHSDLNIKYCNNSIMRQFLSNKNHCYKQCLPECNETHYEFRVGERITKNVTTIELIQQDVPQRIVSQEPELYFASFLGQVAGYVALCTGWSAFYFWHKIWAKVKLDKILSVDNKSTEVPTFNNNNIECVYAQRNKFSIC